MLSSTLDLISLPVEILVRIYESLGSFATVANLACCCSFMDTVYVANKAPISHAILRLDPILVGNSTDTSFYHQAVGIFLEGQKKINGTVNEGGNGDNADNYQLVDSEELLENSYPIPEF